MAIKARHVYQFGPFRLDATDRLLYREGELVALAPKAFDTLLLLVTNSGHVLGKDEMMKQLWPDTFVEEGTLAQYVSLLRKALGDSAAWIENHPRRGYRFTAPVEQVEAAPAELRIEEHIRSRTVIEEEIVAEQRPTRPSPIIWTAMALLGIVVTAALIWINARGDPHKSFASVAVLPFRTVSDSGGDYLADGITEALITRLTNLNGLRVVSYSRVRRFKGSSEEAAQIGRHLGVEAVIDGTVRVISGRLRVSVHGIDTRSGYTIWAIDRLEAEPEKLPDIEGQLAEAAAHRMRGELTARERDLVTRSRSTNAEAYELVLKARIADPETAVRLLQQAVQLDPAFADAYGWLALAQLQTYWAGRAGPGTLRKAISNANQALSKDPNASVAIRTLVHIQHETGRDVEGLLMARRALETSPDDLDVIAAAAEAYFRNGLYDRAIPLYEKALAGEPTSTEFRRQLARLYLFLGQHNKGIEVISPLPLSTTGSQKRHSRVELFCGITPFLARPTRKALRGIHGWPGDRRGARRPAGAFEELLQGVAAARGAQEHRADGCAAGSCERGADAPVLASPGGEVALERRSSARASAQPGISPDAAARARGGVDH